MGQIRVVLLFNEENERQKEIGEYLKSQKRCKTALITELVYAWLHKKSSAVASYNSESIDIEEVKRQDNVCVENVVDEQKDKGLDLDEEMLMTGLAMFENDF